MNSSPEKPPVERSTFVTVLGWSFTVLAALSVFFGLIQLLLVVILVDQEALRAGMRTEHSADELPALIRFTFAHLRSLTAVFLVLSVLLLAASVGLLQRRNWARWLFIGFMVLAVVSHLAPLAGGAGLVEWTAGLLAGAPGEMSESMQGFVHATWLVFAVLSVLLAAVFVWIIRKLMTPPVSDEFR